jgi:prepilin-type N-terminal cleavage/methylation domain-containing protein
VRGRRATNAAFTLVELAIVLVILGLLVGGVIVGQNLIRAAELRAVTVELAQYQSAVLQFRDRYRALPGDMNNATLFWGAAAVCPPTLDAPLTSQATCNGNGNGLINVHATANEFFTFWQHLSNAGLIEGNYSGATNFSTHLRIDVNIGVNIPESRLGRAGWLLSEIGDISIAHSRLFEGFYNRALLLGLRGSSFNWPGSASATDTVNSNPILSPKEMWNIDTKMDDGQPGKGKLVTLEMNTGCYLLADGSPGSTSTTEPRADVRYNLQNTSKACALVFRDVW